MGAYFYNIFPKSIYDEDLKIEKIIKFLRYIHAEKLLLQSTTCRAGISELFHNHDELQEYITQKEPIPRDLLVSATAANLKIITERRVFFNDQLDEILCPICQKDNYKEDWSSAIDEWYTGKSQGNLRCASCKSQTPITNYRFNPTWGFSNVGFEFYNNQELWERIIAKSTDLEDIFESEVGWNDYKI